MDYDITSKHHGGDPLSTAAHANTRGERIRTLDRVVNYIESRPHGANFREAMNGLGLIRNTVTSRFSDAQAQQLALPVAILHQYGMFTHIKAKRAVPGGRTPAQVLIGRQHAERIYGLTALFPVLAATVKPSRVKGVKAPIEQMTDSLWMIYNHVDQCGRPGTTADTAQWRLGLDQGNCSNLFRDLRKIKAVIPVEDLHKHGLFRDIRGTRQTRNHQGAAVLVSFAEVARSGISKELFGLLFTEAEAERLERLFPDPHA